MPPNDGESSTLALHETATVIGGGRSR
ncbi:hypothetical protein ID866_9559 [Astraeus odoratus]|nr:hypothetical protein ID866_9559 [Astraeus odoratus]